VLNLSTPHADRAPQPGLHHVSAGLDVPMDGILARDDAHSEDPAVARYVCVICARGRGDRPGALRLLAEPRSQHRWSICFIETPDERAHR
jgi:hypothetical protein